MLKIYYAKAMTGRTGQDLLSEAREIQWLSWLFEVEALDPVIAEGVKEGAHPLANDLDHLNMYWQRDKEMVRDAHVLIDTTGPAKSEGVAHEVGYARYCLWKPVVRVYEGLGPSIARIEDDYIANSLPEAIKFAKANWGTKSQRIFWRVKMLAKSLPKFIKYQLGEWK